MCISGFSTECTESLRSVLFVSVHFCVSRRRYSSLQAAFSVAHIVLVVFVTKSVRIFIAVFIYVKIVGREYSDVFMAS